MCYCGDIVSKTGKFAKSQTKFFVTFPYTPVFIPFPHNTALGDSFPNHLIKRCIALLANEFNKNVGDRLRLIVRIRRTIVSFISFHFCQGQITGGRWNRAVSGFRYSPHSLLGVILGGNPSRCICHSPHSLPIGYGTGSEQLYKQVSDMSTFDVFSMPDSNDYFSKGDRPQL